MHLPAKTALAAAVLAASAGAFAQQSPFYVGAGLSVGRDSNVFRAPDGSAVRQGDNFSSAFALVGIDQPFGRQRFFADAKVTRTQYEDITSLNNTGHAANIGLDWAAIDKLSGTLRYGNVRTRSQQNLDATVITQRNLETAQEFLARAQYGGESVLAIEAELLHRSLDYSALAFSSQENSYDSVRAGVLYRLSGALRLGAGVRATKGEYPNAVVAGPGVFTADEFDRNDIDLTAQWVPTGASTINARLSFGKQENSAVATRDFSGATGSVAWDWQPTGKLRLNTRLSRDTGLETTFIGLTGSSRAAVADASRLSTTFQLGAVWEATAKIQLNADARYVRRSLVNTGGVTINESDRTSVLGIGATYKPTRTIELGCQASREQRDTSGTLLTYPYTADLAQCFAQIVLR